MLPAETVQRAPKALLHDHLDGGLRPSTIVDLAAEYGYDGLPTTEPEALAAGRGAAARAPATRMPTIVLIRIRVSFGRWA